MAEMVWAKNTKTNEYGFYPLKKCRKVIKKADMCFTDPPYNVCLKYGKYKDDKSKDDYIQFNKDWFSIAQMLSTKQIVFTGNINNKMWLKEFNPDYVGIWDKGDGATTHGYITNYTAWEPIFFHGKYKRKRHTDVFRIAAGGSVGIKHACPKPIKLLIDILNNFSEQDNNILDLFGGSGSTLIACEKINKHCFVMEIDELYIDVIVQRWVKYMIESGKQSEIIIKKNGKIIDYKELM